jgi:hypothetical protein
MINDRDTVTSHCVAPAEAIVQLKNLIEVDPHLVHADDIQFKWNGTIVDKNRSFTSYGIPSGSHLELGVCFARCCLYSLLAI